MVMPSPVHDERKLRSVSCAALTAYLTAHDWKAVANWAERATVYGKTIDGREQRIWVPVRETFADYADNMERSIQILAQTENRASDTILVELQATVSDSIRVATLHGQSERTLSLQDAGALFRDSLAMLAAAARSAKKPRRAYRGALPTDAAAYLKSISPAPTAFNAFDLTLLSPIPPRYGGVELRGDRIDQMSFEHPFARRAVVRLKNGLRATQEAVADVKQQSNFASFDEAVQMGVSANLCDAVLGLIQLSGEFGDGLSVDVYWAPTRPMNGKQFASISFSTHDAEIIRAAGDRLRSLASFADEHVIADVVGLEREPKEFDGRAILLADVDDRTRRIEVEFAEADYQVAIQAHDEKLVVELDGDLHPVGRSYELRNPRNVRLLEGPGE